MSFKFELITNWVCMKYGKQTIFDDTVDFKRIEEKYPLSKTYGWSSLK